MFRVLAHHLLCSKNESKVNGLKQKGLIPHGISPFHFQPVFRPNV